MRIGFLDTFMKVVYSYPWDSTLGLWGHRPSSGNRAVGTLTSLRTRSVGLRLPRCCFCCGHRERYRQTHPLVSHPPQVPEEMSRCRNSYTEQELKPLTLEALGRLRNDEAADYQHFLQDCVDSLFKEVKEKFKGWVSYSTSEQAELSYKKVSLVPAVSQWSGFRFIGEETLWPTRLSGSLSTIPSLVDLGGQVIELPR